MPTIRKLYTLGEVRAIIAKIEKVDAENVIIYEASELSLEDCFGGRGVEDETYIFQVDHAD